ncbi:hypothetical protein [Halobiforma nitratireducens]|uniref:Uncharacterized protein n=1 Tax=Halobiforma nitratireducens JCM 10879 TaxID=1227454 RepID=M0LCT0_9EURY|nr:hypothetical protein [Halobiforma nitratireducens]EMA30918.1 hypothetical protein C446_16345 [Halobiforma nitratireducens JCM 10879]
MPSTFGCRLQSRRRVIATVGGGLAAALAGCSGEPGERNESERDDEATDRSESATDVPKSPSEFTTDHETLVVRSSDGERVVYRSTEEAQEVRESDEDDPSHTLYEPPALYVIDEDDAETLWIDPKLSDEDESDVRAFVADTDFETQSIVIYQSTIEDCYDRRLLGVETEEDRARGQFCRRLKPPTTPCEADVEVMDVTVVRLDRAYSERPLGGGYSESASCPPSAVDERGFDADGTESDDHGTDAVEANASSSITDRQPNATVSEGGNDG